ncbi:MAG TPA: hypothetical protein VHW09_27265 [Bryobacteraceae bacterium]|jgi:hypothetical protein|nr:hypothetical protein [Bryobacteraceae bacterium]
MSPRAREPLDIQDYLEASSDASSRTRAALLALIVASIVAFAAVLHTMQGRWMHERILAAQNIRSSYVAKELGPYPERRGLSADEYGERVRHYEHRYLGLCDALVKTDIENFIVSAPFIGFTFDVNDLDVLGAVGLFVVLLVYRFFLARELENLKLSFRAAKALGMAELDKFYILLSMRQVFTTPQSDFKSPSRFRSITHKILIWMPVAVLGVIEYDDCISFDIGADINNIHSVTGVSCGALGLIFSIWISSAVTARLFQMDKIWLDCRHEIEAWKKAQSPAAKSQHH